MSDDELAGLTGGATKGARLLALRAVARSGADRYRRYPSPLSWEEYKVSQEGVNTIFLGLEGELIGSLGPGQTLDWLSDVYALQQGRAQGAR